jgi:hypothetical protein
MYVLIRRILRYIVNFNIRPIILTTMTVLFRYKNYRHNKKKDKIGFVCRDQTRLFSTVAFKMMRWSVFKRSLQNFSTDCIISAKGDQVQIPKISLHEFMWRNLERWPDKTATVSTMTSQT